MNNLAIILSNLSRFDIENNTILSGNAGAYIKYSLLREYFTAKSTPLVTLLPESGELPKLPANIKYCILFGERSAEAFLGSEYKGLNTNRGRVYLRDGVKYICTYAPQDAFDIKASYENLASSQQDEEDEVEENEKGDYTVTSRKNWRGWMTLDILKLLNDGITLEKPKTEVRIRPSIDYVCALLEEDSMLFVDIETSYEEHELTVLGLGFLSSKRDEVCVIELYDHNGERTLELMEIAKLFRQLVKRFSTNGKVIAHNSLFDFLVLAYKYHIPPPEVIEDTMLMHHRLHTELEKSLGHCISLYTNLPFHKDEGLFNAANKEQQNTLLAYNGKDVVATMLIWKSLDSVRSKSMDQVNNSIRHYIINSLTGILVDEKELANTVSGSKLAMEQYQRVCNTLVGPSVKYLPSSSQSCATYFHDVLDYKVKKRSLGTGKPSVDEGVLWKLKLEHPLNLVIDFSIKYREAQKINSIEKVKLWQTPIEQLQSNISEIISTDLQPILLTDPNHLNKPQSVSPTSTSSGSLVDTMMDCPRTFQEISLRLSILKQLSQKLKSPLKQNLSFQRTHRMTTGWKLAGTTTYRLASAKLLSKYGTNLQNPNKQTLNCFVADEGYTFVQVDQAGAEALVVAYLCRAGRFRALFEAGIKSHTYLACHLFTAEFLEYGLQEEWLASDVDFKAVKAHTKWKAVAEAIAKSDIKYYMAKQTCHSANYRVGAKTFCLSMLKNSGGKVNLKPEDGKRLLDTYYRLFPEILEWHSEIDSEVKRNRCLRNLQGFERKFYSYIEEDGREAYAFKPQSTVGSITNIAFSLIGNYITRKELNWFVLNNKHDSILLQVPDNEVDEACSVLSYFMEAPLVGRDGANFFMKSECSIGKNWGKYHEVDKPAGMRDYSKFRETEFNRSLPLHLRKDGSYIRS